MSDWKRPDGFYWIKQTAGAEPEVAQYKNADTEYKSPYWLIVGWEYPLYEEDIYTVYEQAVPQVRQ